MKTVAVVLTLLATISATSALAEGGADRLRERSDQLALQRQQAEQVAKRDVPLSDQSRVGQQQGLGSDDKPSS
ncbi:co-regulatory protein PtrA N-terminal domain-containing protein [Pseudomonas mosselii]|uniref:co-regulatory protein PtrA N-terminal domain-containing protein n=1 Tax=Pseudomonas mosselii TaxID=78327 RepID=UPI0027DCBB43|nr:co-regulatory protein PtrA N-terminal domain-containing protein [Pseudomonas mosselii]